MKFENGSLTNKGQELMSRVLSEEKKLILTRCSLGAGITDEQVDRVNLVSPKLDTIMIEAIPLEGVAELEIIAKNEELEEGFIVKEMGIFAKLEGDSNDILLYYANTSDDDFFPNKVNPFELKLILYMTITNSDDVIGLEIDPQVQLLTRAVADSLYERIINKLTGFNLDKTDSVSSSSSILLATAKAVKVAFDKGVEALNKANTKENAFSKNSGFNKNKTDSLTTDDSNILATAKAIKSIWDNLTSHRNSNTNPHVVTKSQVGLGSVNNWGATSSVEDSSNTKYATAGAVKTAYDKGEEALSKANTKEDAFSKNTGFNKNKSDSITSSSSDTLATSKAVKDAHEGAKLKRTILFNGSTNSTATHGDISSYLFIAFEFKSARYEHRMIPTEMWTSRGQTAITRRGGENADKDYDAYLTKVSNTQTRADGNAVLYKIYGYKY